VSITTGTVVVVDDDQDACDLLAAALRKDGHAVKAFTSPEAALEHVASELVDVIVSDVSMAGMDGVELCERARRVQPDVPVVLVTGQGSLEVAIRALRAEAFDFVLKPVDMAEMGPRLRRAIEHRGIKREIDRLQRETVSSAPVANIVGNSPAMRRVYELVRRVGHSEASILISGETGTGKELVARAIHAESMRRNGPFVARVDMMSFRIPGTDPCVENEDTCQSHTADIGSSSGRAHRT
jgi:two-component system response regulator HydG